MHKRRDRLATPFFLSVSGSQDDAYQCCDYLCENCAPPDHYLAAEQRRQSEHQNKHEHGLGEGKDIGQHVLLGCVKCRR